MAAKRRVLVDALMMCLSKSRVVQVVDGETVRGVFDSASKEMWREGEFRLDPVWKILIAQPGLTAEDVAPPLLVFKAYENELGVVVRIPQALSAIPRGEQIRLRDALGIERADFAKAIEEMKALAASESAAQGQQELVRAAEATTRKDDARKPATGAHKKVAKQPTAQSRMLAMGLALGALVALGFGVWFALRDTSSGLRSVGRVEHAAAGQRARGRPVADGDHRRSEVGLDVGRRAQEGRRPRSWTSRSARGSSRLILLDEERARGGDGERDAQRAHGHRSVKSGLHISRKSGLQ